MSRKGYVARNKEGKYFLTQFCFLDDIDKAKVWRNKDNIFASWSGPDRNEFSIIEVETNVIITNQ